MPLDDREQKILEEIERHLYEEDPRLARTVATAPLGGRRRLRQRLAAVAFLVGIVVMLGSFTTSPFVAGLGFVVMVASAGYLAMTVRAAAEVGAVGSGWLDRFQDRWRRER